jgi:TetR/AcrR family transcriptional regulator, cholesterol catabolism regulator
MAATQSGKSSADAKLNGGGTKTRRRDREVLKAATKVFYRRGYADATVQDVADSLGMLKGSLYYYIKSKEELLSRLATEVHDDVDGLLAEAAARDDLSALQRLEAYVRQQVEYNVRNLEAISVYYHDVDHLSPGPRKEIVERRRQHEAVIVSWVEQGQRDGDIDPNRSAYTLSQCVFATVIWIYRWYRPSMGMDVAELSDTCAWFVNSGLSGPHRPDPRGAGPS